MLAHFDIESISRNPMTSIQNWIEKDKCNNTYADRGVGGGVVPSSLPKLVLNVVDIRSSPSSSSTNTTSSSSSSSSSSSFSKQGEVRLSNQKKDLCRDFQPNTEHGNQAKKQKLNSISESTPSLTKNGSELSLLAAASIFQCENKSNEEIPQNNSSSTSRLCTYPGCTKCAQGNTSLCIAHGGGRRCTVPGCIKAARDKFYCAGHGGGKRCSVEDCKKAAVGGSNLCTAHGGGKRCQEPGCMKSSQASTMYCVRHGGGRKCIEPNCNKAARSRTNYCASHGGLVAGTNAVSRSYLDEINQDYSMISH